MWFLLAASASTFNSSDVLAAWSTEGDFDDWFTIEVDTSGGQVRVKRGDQPRNGWGLPLQFYCCGGR